ncbi:cell division protein FtsW [Candidatus Daviesbacteria bacterium RIFCSPHIGHO2_02_FULL_39_12]|uniref:Probable peptidoglycan glycosyltransferase FtsW n=2 Tax=Candidatus Daviesiibacteriota TaxID=1752718 RepID=A0A1F5JCC7_9BACT|nr:MAG: cell division protein FtsW [Candidatus Daviesbacteria bacterium RIFCSPHIGHO2_02_FULL_39_12]OGE72025.1 MAG: cell division protein FtsW [Candidatus Daviesbacteria bacterium RIFCSPLOWO2_02_FULL_38_15]
MKKIGSLLKSQTHSIDTPFLVSTMVLVIFGLVMVYDASFVQGLKDFNDGYFYIKQQLIWAFLGIISMIFFSRIDYKKLKFLAIPLLIFSFILLLAVFIPGLGVAGGGAHRWLKISRITIQPAEIIKLTGVIYLASVFSKRVRFIPVFTLVSLVTIITAILQKDLGSTLVFVTTATLLYFISGGPLWHFLVILPAGLAGFLALIFTSGYRSKRILAFLDPFSDTQGSTYHISQVLIALGSGGLFGLGLGHSRQKFEYIPEVSTDSIFGIIGEELGFLGASLLLIIFIFVVLRGFKIAANCPDPFGRILSLGLICWLGIQIVVNLSSMTSLLPLTGVPLPFISYGGSALVVNLTAVGILLNISKQTT